MGCSTRRGKAGHHASQFLPYEDGLSLFVHLDEGAERQIRLQWRKEEQGAIIDALPTYLVVAD
jgi:hypothetical protein